MIEKAAAKPSHNEVIKEANPALAGNLALSLADPQAEKFSDDDAQFLKFHGIYQQDDRDVRKIAKKFIFMVRTRLSGGVLAPKQYLVLDRLAADYGNNTLRLTTRQGFQFHGIVKSGLGSLVKSLNEALITTLAACGDDNRNVMASNRPATSPLTEQVYRDAQTVSDALLPKTPAYHQIWVEGKQLDLNDPAIKDFEDPLYGKRYLPRKFKTAFVIPPLNDIDIYTNDLGFVAINEGGRLAGYNLLAGGGMGMSHGNAATFPRLADVIGFFQPDQVVEVAKGVLGIHRDFGDRSNRKHARLKYVLEDHGVAWFREELERRVGFRFESARPFEFTRQGDLYGWQEQLDGKLFLGVYVEMGRIQDTETVRLKSALREVAEKFAPEFRITPAHNLILANIDPDDREPITRIFKEHGMDPDHPPGLTRRGSMACPALPTCGLALAESERTLPGLLEEVDDLLADLGLKDQELIIRMTGCPNGCARPYMAEIGLVGRAPNKYQLYVGGNENSTRLNRLYKQNVKGDQILPELRELLSRYGRERQSGERFGDWSDRVLFSEQPGEGTA